MAEDVIWSTHGFTVRKSAPAVEKAPEEVEPLDYATVLSFARGSATFAKLVNWTPSSVAAACEVGRTLLEQGRMGEAQAIFEALSSANPNDPYVLGALGIAYRGQGFADDAMLAFKAALALRPGLGFAALQLVELQIEEGFGDDARNTLKHAIDCTADGPTREKMRGLAIALGVT
ncbi:MAG: tetratricopeptide repeat protein [Myxococcota bacterium]